MKIKQYTLDELIKDCKRAEKEHEERQAEKEAAEEAYKEFKLWEESTILDGIEPKPSLGGDPFEEWEYPGE